jgi:hypothetical protein
MGHLQRNGVPSIISIAKELCRLVVKFTPIITKQYPDNDELLAALAAANVACVALAAQAELVRELGD